MSVLVAVLSGFTAFGGFVGMCSFTALGLADVALKCAGVAIVAAVVCLAAVPKMGGKA